MTEHRTGTRDEWLALRCQARELGAFEALVAEMQGRPGLNLPESGESRKLRGRC